MEIRHAEQPATRVLETILDCLEPAVHLSMHILVQWSLL